MTEGLKYKTGSIENDTDYIRREEVFRHSWMNIELAELRRKYILLRTFANGLQRDIDAVENAVAYDY